LRYQNSRADRAQDEGYADKYGHDFFLAPTRKLKMMVQRRHLEYSFSLPQLVASDLYDNRKGLDQENESDYRKQQFHM